MAPIGAKLCQNAFQTIPIKSIFDDFFFRRKFLASDNMFLPFRSNFGGRTGKRTSKSNSSQLFALDAHILSSVRPKNDQNMSVSAVKTLGGYGYLRVPVFRRAIILLKSGAVRFFCRRARRLRRLCFRRLGTRRLRRRRRRLGLDGTSAASSAAWPSI